MGYTTQGNGPALLTTCIVCLVLTWAFFSVRIYTRAFLTKVWKIEDWLFVASQVSFTVYALVSLQSTLHGNGQFNRDIDPVDIPIAMRWFYWGEILYIITALLMRLSIGFFILRIMTQRNFIWTIRITMGLITLATVMDLFYTIFQCKPIRYFWLQFSGLPGRCLPAPQVQAISIAYSAASAFADILFGVLPMCVLWNLQMNRKAKLIVGVLLCVGIVAGLTVIVRIKYIVDVSLTEDFMYATAVGHLFHSSHAVLEALGYPRVLAPPFWLEYTTIQHKSSFYLHADIPIFQNVSIWALIEPAIAICCMSASTLRPLFKSLRDKTSAPSGYGIQPTGPGNRYFKSGSNPVQSKQDNNFGSSRNHSGYTKRMDNNQETGSYDDAIALRTLVVGADGRTSEGDDDTKGILTSTTVEISRYDRRGDDKA
ncbi:hypothetical protein DL95DRAFT_463428 [Leptodontidium sp. 2 PMI_412]|nr:hypothetical protein BKA61DRAFT_700048 [Leptodontidium sp. MPI-SDFR-AT-0119]KAH9212951.1 hypothetical protein DL95DRAFT_463428 [Leptodontidium sp. 2 PMI_412]